MKSCRCIYNRIHQKRRRERNSRYIHSSQKTVRLTRQLVRSIYTSTSVMMFGLGVQRLLLLREREEEAYSETILITRPRSMEDDFFSYRLNGMQWLKNSNSSRCRPERKKKGRRHQLNGRRRRRNR